MESGRGKKYLFLSSICLSILCLLIFVINRESLAAATPDPNFYYYSGGRKIVLPLSKEMVAVRFKHGVGLEKQRAIVESEEDLGMFSERREISIFELTLFPIRQGITEENIIETINSLDGKSEVGFANPVYDFPVNPGIYDVIGELDLLSGERVPVSVSIEIIPEPASILLFAFGALLVRSC